MSKTVTNPPKKFDKKLLKILACPAALQDNKGKTGKLRLYKDAWLISDESKYKYPIIDSVPILLVSIGKQFRQAKESELPVPAPHSLIEG